MTDTAAPVLHMSKSIAAHGVVSDAGRVGLLAVSLPYHTFVREERQFCAVLQHLLVSSTANMTGFLELVEAAAGTPLSRSNSAVDPALAEVYVEFAFLRDYWHTLETDADRHAFLRRLIDRLPHGRTVVLPDDRNQINTRFGASRLHKETQIGQPGQWWTVEALDEVCASTPDGNEAFRELCMLKWAFRIKPDLVVLHPDLLPVCVEAKVESLEGTYPVARSECAVFDRRFGPRQRRVKQRTLQEFLFRRLLGIDVQMVAITKSGANLTGSAALTWTQVFARLDTTSSLPIVKRLIESKVLT